MSRFVTVCCLLGVALGPLWAQETESGEPTKDEAREQLKQLLGSPDDPADETTLPPNFPEAPDPVLADEETRAAYQRSAQAYYRYRSDSYSFREGVFQWQFISSVAIFIVVLMLVGVGVYFAWIQFKQRMKAGADQETSEIEISLQGIKASSSVLGVIILVISLAFFYLYLRYVYPIEDVF